MNDYSKEEKSIEKKMISKDSPVPTRDSKEARKKAAKKKLKKMKY